MLDMRRGSTVKRILKWIVIGIGALFIIGLISTAIDGKPSSSFVTNDNGGAVANPAASWQTVVMLSGNADKRSDDFQLTGAPARMKYTLKGDTSPILGIYIVESGHSIQKEGGIPEVLVQESGSDSTRLAQSAGTYYLDVTAANGSWTVQIEEQR